MEHSISTQTNLYTPYGRPDDGLRYNPLVDYELGGFELNNSDQGLAVQWWKLEYDGVDKLVLTPLQFGQSIELLTGIPNVTEVSLAFSGNMDPHVTYVSNGIPYLWWFDSQKNGGQMELTNYSSQGITSPRLTYDIHNPIIDSALADVIFAYIRNNNLYYRRQKERFGVERVLKDQLWNGVKLNKVGLNQGNRLQYEIQ